MMVFPVKQVYTNLEGDRANVVHTAWAVLSLIKAGQVSILYPILTGFILYRVESSM